MTARGRPSLPAAVACLALLALALGACGEDEGGESDGGSAAKEAVKVNIKSFKFAAKSVRVTAGGTVTFVNRDKAPHTAQTDLSSKKAEFDTGRLETSDTKPVELERPGRFSYFCAYHQFMRGTVEVVE